MESKIVKYKISGKDRRIVKKRLSELKLFLKDFWYTHQMDKDMASFYGGSFTYPMSDEDAQLLYDETNEEVVLLQKKLEEHE